MHLNSITRLLVACAVCLAPSLAGVTFTTRQVLSDWYGALVKPSFTPPGWLFGPVWTTLYLLMGVSVFLVWQNGLRNRTVRLALVCFLVQLVLNALWTPLFFGLQNLLLAFIEILVLWAAILVTIVAFRKVSIVAALLLCPYILWVSFAAILNASIWLLNRQNP